MRARGCSVQQSGGSHHSHCHHTRRERSSTDAERITCPVCRYGRGCERLAACTQARKHCNSNKKSKQSFHGAKHRLALSKQLLADEELESHLYSKVRETPFLQDPLPAGERVRKVRSARQ